MHRKWSEFLVRRWILKERGNEECGLIIVSLDNGGSSTGPAKRQPRVPRVLPKKQGLSLPAEPNSGLFVPGDRKCVLPSETLKEHDRNGIDELHQLDFPLLFELQQSV